VGNFADDTISCITSVPKEVEEEEEEATEL
jgi:hypothetical protein